MSALETPSPRWFSIYSAGLLIAERVITLSGKKYKTWLLWMSVSEIWFWSQLGGNCVSVRHCRNAQRGSVFWTTGPPATAVTLQRGTGLCLPDPLSRQSPFCGVTSMRAPTQLTAAHEQELHRTAEQAPDRNGTQTSSQPVGGSEENNLDQSGPLWSQQQNARVYSYISVLQGSRLWFSSHCFSDSDGRKDREKITAFVRFTT